MMDARGYERIAGWWRARPKAAHAMRMVNRALKYLGYLMYPLVLVLVFAFDRALCVQMLVVPLVGFAFVTVLRRAVNERRPYEALDIDPLIHKDTKGKSFPSRHLFSMTMIAMCWLRWCAPVGAIMLALCVVMACVRVIGGVHWAHDVVVGALFGILFGIVGFWLIPWPGV